MLHIQIKKIKLFKRVNKKVEFQMQFFYHRIQRIQTGYPGIRPMYSNGIELRILLTINIR